MIIHHSDRDAVWIAVRGELDLTGAPRLSGALETALGRARLVVLDLRELSFIDSTGMGAILRAHRLAVGEGRRLVLIRGPLQLERMLAVTGLSSVLEVTDLDVLGNDAE